MNDYLNDIDPALLAEFIDESIDFLTEIDNLFVQLEASPDDHSIIESIFRPIHSIKGNSAFFGMMSVKALAHEMETLLDLVRKDDLVISQSLIDVLLEGVDQLKNMLLKSRGGEPEIDDQAAFEDLVERVKAHGAEGEGDSGAALGRVLKLLEGLKESLDPSQSELIERIDAAIHEVKALVPAEKEPGYSDGDPRVPWPDPLRNIHRALGAPIEETLSSEEATAVLERVASLKECTESEEVQAQLDELLETCNTFMESVGFDELLKEIIMDKLEELSRPGVWMVEEDAPPEESSPAETSPAGQSDSPDDGSVGTAAKTAAEPQKTMRVSESDIDTFLSFVGELLVVGDMFNHLHAHANATASDQGFVKSFKLASDTFASLSDNLQQSIMSVRKVKMNALVQKVPRLVRDIASKLGKEIVVKLEGEEIQVDKSLIDLLDAPLTHMVRNSADHGIETPDVRESLGKERTGTILISAKEDSTMLTLSIVDDGAGLDLDKIRAKAESMGLIGEGQALTQDKLVDFIFQSGVSTAEEVTDVSGRGVGMNVVKRMIEEAEGSITVETERDKGSTFRMHLPKSVTTQIIQGYLVESCDQCFVLPMNKVLEAGKLAEGLVTELPGGGRCIKRHDNLYPLVSLRSALGFKAVSDDAPDPEEIVITVETRKGAIALSVDAVKGVQKVVFREMNGLTSEFQGIAGGALMGDGSVSLILDVDEICQEHHVVVQLAS